jgi:hypothetical protein
MNICYCILDVFVFHVVCPHSFQTSRLTGVGDEHSSYALQEAASLERCRRLRRAKHIHHPVFPHSAYHRKSPRHFTGSACSTNKTLSFIAMDSLQFHQFAAGLGIDVLARHDKTALVIFNVVVSCTFILVCSQCGILETIHISV